MRNHTNAKLKTLSGKINMLLGEINDRSEHLNMLQENLNKQVIAQNHKEIESLHTRMQQTHTNLKTKHTDLKNKLEELSKLLPELNPLPLRLRLQSLRLQSEIAVEIIKYSEIIDNLSEYISESDQEEDEDEYSSADFIRAFSSKGAPLTNNQKQIIECANQIRIKITLINDQITKAAPSTQKYSHDTKTEFKLGNLHETLITSCMKNLQTHPLQLNNNRTQKI